VAKKIIFSFLAGSIITFIIVWAISSGQNNIIIKRLSDTITASNSISKRIEQNNFDLIESNTRLSETNKQLQTTVDRLAKSIRDRDTEYQRQLEEIRNRFGNISVALGTISEGLISSTGSIQNIIDGIEQIKSFIKSLKID
jgi:methyl-accepting chemotaxis protein